MTKEPQSVSMTEYHLQEQKRIEWHGCLGDIICWEKCRSCKNSNVWRLKHELESFPHRIIFASMINDNPDLVIGVSVVEDRQRP